MSESIRSLGGSATLLITMILIILFYLFINIEYGSACLGGGRLTIKYSTMDFNHGYS